MKVGRKVIGGSAVKDHVRVMCVPCVCMWVHVGVCMWVWVHVGVKHLPSAEGFTQLAGREEGSDVAGREIVDSRRSRE